MFNEELYELANEVILGAKKSEAILTIAESCTGGLVAALLTSIAGSSAVFERGFVTYSNIAKHEMINVPLDILNQYGAVSSQTANAMAVGALKASRAKIAVSITGIAGPGGGSAEKPVGLVYFGLAKNGHLARTFEHQFGDIGRNAVRETAAKVALNLFLRAL
jgi:nicotinamide-nucleotide amidase